MEEKNKRKGIIYLIIALVTLLALIAGATYAYFQAVTGNNAIANLNATTSTVDNLTFNKGNDITIKATQQNFTETSGNKTGSTNVSATLVANNSTNTATASYNVYLEITANDFEYSSYTDPEEEYEDLVFTNEYDKTLGNNRDYNGLTKGYNPIPELFLTITGPNSFDKEIPNLTKATLRETDDSYDITELREGIYPIAEDVAINVTDKETDHKKTDEWNITVTFKNLETDQELNTKKTFNGRIIIQAEKIANDLMDVCSEGGLLADCIQQLHDKSVYGASNLIYHDGENDEARGETAGELEAGDSSYRYSGSYEKVNNYICLGTDCNSNKDNLFRIVGTFGNDGIKVVKADYANKELLGAGTTTPTDLSQADPKTNGSYTSYSYNATTGTNSEKDAFTHRYKGNLTQVDRYRWQENGSESTPADWKTALLNTIHLNTNYYNSIDSTYRSLITPYTWIWGNDNATFDNIALGTNSKSVYDYEIGTNSTTNRKTTEPENIGLLYVSDYLYGATPSNWNKKPFTGTYGNTSDGTKIDKFGNPAGGFSKKQVNNDYRSTTDSNWLYMGLWEWLITQRCDYTSETNLPSGTFAVRSTGSVDYSVSGGYTYVVRPTFYITNDAILNGGIGTIENPYTLKI